MGLKWLNCGKELIGCQRKYCSKICRGKKYRRKPEVKEWIRKYRKKPEVKESIRKYRQKPEVREKIRRYNKLHYAIPEVRKRQREWVRRYRIKPEVKERITKSHQLYNLKTQLRRSRIFYIYNNKCAKCGYDKVLDIHHINSNGDTDRRFKKGMKEYIVLCPNCHALVTRRYLTKQDILPYQKKWLYNKIIETFIY